MLCPQPLGSFARLQIAVWLLTFAALEGTSPARETTEVGFAAREIAPLEGRPVWMAGYGTGRRSTGVHDPPFARCLVLRNDGRRIALVSLDLIGLPYPTVQRIRDELPEFDYVLVASTHNHEGPDVIGLWGRTPFHRGVDDGYVTFLIGEIAAAAREAEQAARPAIGAYGTAEDSSLVEDHRLPLVKDGVLRSLLFTDPINNKPRGIVVQWSCHPETLGARNTLLTADFPAATIASLEDAYGCPVVYFSGALGGFMGPPEGRISGADGQPLRTGQFEFSHRYGDEVAHLAVQAIRGATTVELSPLVVQAKTIEIPIENPLYRLARTIGVIRRQGRVWTGNFEELGPPVTQENVDQPHGTVTEVAYLRIGDVQVAAIPGEIYPELVYGAVEDPPQPGADFPTAKVEPSIASVLAGDKFFVFGLSNDEIGYILPRRQWDLKPPFTYGRSTSQYGEIHSCGPLTGPIVCEAFAKCVREARERR